MDTVKNVDDLVSYIQNLNFSGSYEEIQVQRVLALDKYIKENIDYGFDAVNFSIENPNLPNPYGNAFSPNGFFEDKVAVCGSISRVANEVLNRLGIKSDYVWGHFTTEINGQQVSVGHRWNKIVIGNMNFMVDFTTNLSYYKCYVCYDEKYKQIMELVKPQDINNVNENEFLFFSKLPEKMSLGGFIDDSEKGHVDDLDEKGKLKNTTKDVLSYFGEEMNTLPDEYVKNAADYVEQLIEGKKREIAKDDISYTLTNSGNATMTYVFCGIILFLIIVILLIIMI